jgi:hypothetical protein
MPRDNESVIHNQAAMSGILSRRLVPIVLGALAAFAPASGALSQASADTSPQAEIPIVVRNVHVIPMDTERVEPGQTVVILGDRIVSIGPAAEASLPDGATVIDGDGQYLLPGLTDGHVHLESWAGSRPDFGDAALYLAHGVTTVINLRGTPTFLDWKRRVQAGELIGPTIYTAGELIIGPRGPTLRRESGEVVVGPNATTPADIEIEVARQAADGVDAIKYYGGLTRPAYLRIAQVAREAGVSLVGHRPMNLGFGELLEARQSLAHVYMLSNLYFWPISSSRGYLLASVGALAFLLLIVATWWRPATRDISRARLVTRTLLLAALIVVLLLVDGFTVNLAGLEGTPLLALLTAAAAILGIGTIALVTLTARIWRDGRTPVRARLHPSVATIAAAALAVILAMFWVPVSWRYTPAGVDSLAARLRDAGITAQTTLIAFEGLTSGPDKLKSWQDDPALEYLSPGVRTAWRRLPLPQGAIVSSSAFDFMKRVTASLHRAGVPLVAGTDALGAPLIVPGTSLHRELHLLAECGLTPWEAIRTATVNPAVFLGREQEFGRVAVGMRADLLLVEENPLRNLETLKQPVGVMVRGRWFARHELQGMLAALRTADR